MYIYMDQAGSCTACRQWFIPDMGSYRLWSVRPSWTRRTRSATGTGAAVRLPSSSPPPNLSLGRRCVHFCCSSAITQREYSD